MMVRRAPDAAVNLMVAAPDLLEDGTADPESEVEEEAVLSERPSSAENQLA